MSENEPEIEIVDDVRRRIVGRDGDGRHIEVLAAPRGTMMRAGGGTGAGSADGIIGMIVSALATLVLDAAIDVAAEGRPWKVKVYRPRLLNRQVHREVLPPRSGARRAHAPAMPSQHLDAAETSLRQWATELRASDPADAELWRQASREAAAVTSTMSRTLGPAGAALAGVGQTLSRQALTVVDERPSAPATPRPRHGPSPAQQAARHMQVALRASGPGAHPGWVAVLQQLRQVLAAIEDARRARQELVAASQLAGAGKVVDAVQHEARSHHATDDLDGLRQAHRARGSSSAPGRGEAVTGTLTARPASRSVQSPALDRGRRLS